MIYVIIGIAIIFIAPISIFLNARREHARLRYRDADWYATQRRLNLWGLLR